MLKARKNHSMYSCMGEPENEANLYILTCALLIQYRREDCNQSKNCCVCAGVSRLGEMGGPSAHKTPEQGMLIQD